MPWAPVNTSEHGVQASVEHDSAAAVVLRLLSNSMLPETSWLPILYQAVPLLERQELPPLFNVEDTSTLLAHLQVPYLIQVVPLVLLQGCRAVAILLFKLLQTLATGPKRDQCIAASTSDLQQQAGS